MDEGIIPLRRVSDATPLDDYPDVNILVTAAMCCQSVYVSNDDEADLSLKVVIDNVTVHLPHIVRMTRHEVSGLRMDLYFHPASDTAYVSIRGTSNASNMLQDLGAALNFVKHGWNGEGFARILTGDLVRQMHEQFPQQGFNRINREVLLERLIRIAGSVPMFLNARGFNVEVLDEINGVFSHWKTKWTQDLGVSRWILCGHSLGAMVVQRLNIDHPDCIGISFNPLGGRLLCYEHEIEEESRVVPTNARFRNEDAQVETVVRDWNIRFDEEKCPATPPPKSYVFAHHDDLVWRFAREFYKEHGGTQMAAFEFVIDTQTAGLTEKYRLSASGPRKGLLDRIAQLISDTDLTFLDYYKMVHSMEAMLWTLWTKHKNRLHKSLRPFVLMHHDSISRLVAEGRLLHSSSPIDLSRIVALLRKEGE